MAKKVPTNTWVMSCSGPDHHPVRVPHYSRKAAFEHLDAHNKLYHKGKRSNARVDEIVV